MTALLNFARNNRVHERWIGEIERELHPIIDRPLRSGGAKHFDVVQASETSVRVLAGPAIRYAHGVQYVIALGIDGGGTGTALTEYLTITNVQNSTHIVLDLDDPLAPTTLTASSTGSATYPTGDTTYKRRVLAKVTCAGGKITAIEQYEDGAWRDPFHIVDGLSLSYNSANEQQHYGWDGAAGAAPAAADLFCRKCVAEETEQYSTPQQIVEAVDDWSGIDYSTWVWSHCPYYCVPVPGAKHVELDFADGVAGTAGQNPDHDDRYWIKGSDYTENYGSSVGRATDDEAIDLTNSQLIFSTTANLNWATPALLNDWTATGSLVVTDEIESTNGHIKSGSYVEATTALRIGDGTAVSITDGVIGISTDGHIDFTTSASLYIGVGSAFTSIQGSGIVEIGRHGTGLSFVNDSIAYGVDGYTGQSIASWFAAGGFIKSGAAEITVLAADGNGNVHSYTTVGIDNGLI